jgi:fluoroquinolone transport system permease protein
MSNLMKLIKGEIMRLLRYKILGVGLLVSVVWAVIVYFSDSAELQSLIPMLAGVDATMMSILLLAAGYFLEKQEGSVKSLLVAPVPAPLVLLSKVIAAVLTGLVSGFIVIAAAYIFHDFRVNLLLLSVYLAIIIVAHTAIGYLLTLHSRDFSSLLAYTLLFVFLSFIPTLLFAIKILPASFEEAMLVLPTHAAFMMLTSLTAPVRDAVVIIGALYLSALGLVLYPAVIFKKFKRAIMEG